MIRAQTALCACLILTACGEGREDAAPPVVNRQAEPDDPANSPRSANATTSIMRPSVVAETEQEAPPPAVAEPVRVAISFDSGLLLDDPGRSDLDALLGTPAAAGEAKIVIRGHSDSRGSDAENLRVSRLRAEAVRDYLVERGVSAGRIQVIALGETRPVAPNANPDGSDFEEGRRRNRRVVVEIIPEPRGEPESSPILE